MTQRAHALSRNNQKPHRYPRNRGRHSPRIKFSQAKEFLFRDAVRGNLEGLARRVHLALAEISRGTIRRDRLIQSRLSPGASTHRIRSRAPFIPLRLPPPISRETARTKRKKEKGKEGRKEEKGEEVKDGEERNARSALHCNFDFIKKWRWSFQMKERERAAGEGRGIDGSGVRNE